MERELITVFDEKLFVQLKKKKNVVDSVPNEILRLILARFDAQFLISIRAVCKRWLIVIEDICAEKTTIVLESKGSDDVNIAGISRLLSGWVNFNEKCAILKVKIPSVQGGCDRNALYKNVYLTLVKLFPQVVNLAITSNFSNFVKSEHLPLLLTNWSPTLITFYLPPYYTFPKRNHRALFDAIDNKLTVLKRLSFYDINQLQASTIARLEHCTLCVYHTLDLVPRLGECFTSLCLYKMSQHLDLSPLARLSGQLTHLRIDSQINPPKVLSFICDHFARLQFLDIHFYRGLDFDKIIPQLAKLTQLSALTLDNVNFNMDNLARANLRRPTLKSVQSLSLTRFMPHTADAFWSVGPNFDGNLFCRALSSVMPNIVKLTIKPQDQPIRDVILQNLHHFANLRKHEIVTTLYCYYD